MLPQIEVPALKRETVLKAIRLLGLDPTHVSSLYMHRQYIEVEVMVVNDQGKRVAAGDEAATAAIQIPIVDNQFVAKLPATNGEGKQIAVDAGVT